jgi:hypothetical protein
MDRIQAQIARRDDMIEAFCDEHGVAERTGRIDLVNRQTKIPFVRLKDKRDQLSRDCDATVDGLEEGANRDVIQDV